MSYANRLHTYKSSAVHTATPGMLVLMLLDGGIKYLNIGIKAFDSTDPLELNLTVHNNLTRTQEIIRELRMALDTEKGGDLAQRMESLYHYFDRRLHEANVKKDKAIVEEVLRHITGLRDAWNQSVLKETQAQADKMQSDSGNAGFSMLG